MHNKKVCVCNDTFIYEKRRRLVMDLNYPKAKIRISGNLEVS